MAFDKLSPAFQKDMVDPIFRLQDQVKPIRVYLAVETKSGPLDGLATQIEETAKLPILDDMPSSETESVSSNADPMPPSEIESVNSNADLMPPSETESVSSNADPMPSRVQALRREEKAWGAEHTPTLCRTGSSADRAPGAPRPR